MVYSSPPSKSTTLPLPTPVFLLIKDVPFVLDRRAFPPFLDGLPQLLPEECDGLKVPFTLEELEAAVAGSALSKAPDLQNLSFKFYRPTPAHHWCTPPLCPVLHVFLLSPLSLP